MLIGFIIGFSCGVGVAVWGLNIVREMECEKCTWSPRRGEDAK